MRLKTYPEDHVVHRDRRLGALDQNVHQAIGDFVVQRRDQHWAYQLAVAIDDAEQGVTAIVRGDDLAGSTARQVLLRRLLYSDLPPVETLHVPLLRDDNGVRVAKRTGGHTVADVRARGIPPTRVVGALAASVGLATPGLLRRPQDLIDAWTAGHFGRDLKDGGLVQL